MRHELCQASCKSTPRSSVQKDQVFLNGHNQKIGYCQCRQGAEVRGHASIVNLLLSAIELCFPCFLPCVVRPHW